MKRLKQPENLSSIHLLITLLIIIISLLVFACTGAHKETSSIEKVTDQAVATGDTGKTGDDQEIVCRNLHITGSRFKNRVCATRAEWAVRDGKNKEKTDNFSRDIRGRSGINTGSGSDGMGGMSTGPAR
ncbi:MAG: hypothetical protein GX846_09545 [Deltaproteobacteria bacterium]|jgi:uncharacterized membrane protein YgcG|nr:hypothetical protein [Deltaproteobacteria bacterium]